MFRSIAAHLSCRLLVCGTLVMGALSHVASAALSADRLQSLTSETSAQFQLAYRMHPGEAQQRQEQLNAVVAAWRAAPRTEANNEKLAGWLRAAIRSSMPGSRGPLPATPDFKAVERAQKQPAPVQQVLPQVKPVEKQSVEVEKKPVDVEKKPVGTEKPLDDDTTLFDAPAGATTPTATPTSPKAESAPVRDSTPKAELEVAPLTDENTDPFRDDPGQGGQK